MKQALTTLAFLITLASQASAAPITISPKVNPIEFKSGGDATMWKESRGVNVQFASVFCEQNAKANSNGAILLISVGPTTNDALVVPIPLIKSSASVSVFAVNQPVMFYFKPNVDHYTRVVSDEPSGHCFVTLTGSAE